MWFLIGLFAILSLVFLSGHGAFLIAGYNTASKAEQDRYDKKKMCRIMGVGMTCITALLIVSNVIDDFPSWIAPLCIVIIIVTIIVLLNTICKKKDISTTEFDKQSNSKLGKRFEIIIIFITLIIAGVSMFMGSVNISMTDNDITLKATLTGATTINYSDIIDTTYRTDFNPGSRTGGIGNVVIAAGHFKNSEFGSYMLYSYVKPSDYIIVKTNNGVFVFNKKTNEQTQKLYNDLLQQVP